MVEEKDSKRNSTNLVKQDSNIVKKGDRYGSKVPMLYLRKLEKLAR